MIQRIFILIRMIIRDIIEKRKTGEGGHDMNKQQLASRIWESANRMRSKIEAYEYKDYILGFIFYKFLSEKQTRLLKGLGYTDEELKDFTEDDEDISGYCKDTIGYFISYENLFSTWLEKGSDFNAADVKDALNAFERLIKPSHRKVFGKIFDTLNTGLSKLGDSSKAQTEAIRGLIYLIKDIPMDGRQDYDVLGFIYEYLISKFASNAGKKAGEFYTPQEVSILMSEIVADHLKDREEISIYDPTSGSGSLLINIGKSVSKYIASKDGIKYYAQELKENTYNLTRMNLVMRDILVDNITTRCGDTLEDDWPYFEENDPKGTYNPLYVDAVVSNPPYSQAWNPVDKESDARFSHFGLAPRGKADYAFLLHELYHLKPDGIMTIVLPHGVLFRGGEEGQIRRNLIEYNHIDTVIGLPANIFYGTSIPTIIMVLKKSRETTDIQIIDASKGYEKSGKNNVLRACDIKRIVDAVVKRENIDKFSRVVTREEIRNNDYNLNIPRYVDSSEEAESWDIYASMLGGIPDTEIDGMKHYWDAFPNLRQSLFQSLNEAYSSLNTSEVKKAVEEHPSVVQFMNTYTNAFNGLEDFLSSQLIDSIESIDITKEEGILSDDIFRRLKDIPLVDEYEAYQILHNDWVQISQDLETIQTEGIQSVRQVDPLMVTKKKKGLDVEVQDGWTGHVLPFELVQQTLLTKHLEDIKTDEDRLSEISSSYEEDLDSLSEEDKESSFVSEDKTSFVPLEVKKAIKAKEVDSSVLSILKRVNSNIEEEKKLKKDIKTKTDALAIETKKTIEHLTDSQISELLKRKWISPLIDGLSKLPENIIKDFINKLEKLSKKYETTLSEVEKQISEAEQELCRMLDDLEGNEFDMQGISELKKLLGGM